MRVVLQGAECSDGGRGAGVTLAGVGPELWGPGMGTWGCKQAATPWPVPLVQQDLGAHSASQHPEAQHGASYERSFSHPCEGVVPGRPLVSSVGQRAHPPHLCPLAHHTTVPRQEGPHVWVAMALRPLEGEGPPRTGLLLAQGGQDVWRESPEGWCVASSWILNCSREVYFHV